MKKQISFFKQWKLKAISKYKTETKYIHNPWPLQPCTSFLYFHPWAQSSDLQSSTSARSWQVVEARSHDRLAGPGSRLCYSVHHIRLPLKLPQTQRNRTLLWIQRNKMGGSINAVRSPGPPMLQNDWKLIMNMHQSLEIKHKSSSTNLLGSPGYYLEFYMRACLYTESWHLRIVLTPQHK